MKKLQEKIQEEHERKYKTLKQSIGINQNKFVHSKLVKIKKQQQIAFEYKKMFETALESINFPYKTKKLKNLWDRMNMKPIDPHVQYSRIKKEISYKKKYKYQVIWQNYTVSESGRTSLFNSMERIKLTYSTMQKAMNLSYLLNQRLICQIFPLHDKYEIQGKSVKILFEPYNVQKNYDRIESSVFSPKFLQQKQNNENQQNTLNRNKNKNEEQLQVSLVNSQNDIELSQNFLSFKNTNQPQKNQIQFNDYEKYKQQKEFFVDKLKNLSEIWSFSIKNPWHVPAKEVQQYFGEKIALYYLFMSYYCKQLLFMGVLGIFSFLVQISYDSESYQFVLASVIFGLVKAIWANLFVYWWRRKETKYACLFGQFKKKSFENANSDNNFEERPSFKGKYQRSITNNNLNEIHYSLQKTYVKKVLVALGCMMILIIYLLITIGIFYVSHGMTQLAEKYDRGIMAKLEKIRVSMIIPAVLNYILYNLFEKGYPTVSSLLTNYENHKSVNEYESSYINDCYVHAQFHFGVLYVCLFLSGILGFLSPMIKTNKKKKSQKKQQPSKNTKQQNQLNLAGEKTNEQNQSKKQDNQNYKEEDISNELLEENLGLDKKFFENYTQRIKNLSEDEKIQVLQKNLISKNKNPRKYIEQYIEQESVKQDFSPSSDIYGTVDEYLEISIQFAILIILPMQLDHG
ncbi:hypothetical protein PPERSA_04183 [Pseudocohnilembus persalinus]|uniref:Anoctamin transmembrane domain-containing protein n=1 Tax=Pseudocohnilembus persalinus TaxID=266149 RepID=A0A0V0QMR6_PSEPJ|nr:hypothetical protein PPERSA_04183 [Pseudocohnilembus persalinus]|eukprot:KRX03631.1 hypothetical protein PPERSA_04183 [Pseudocohnilembus persalinus]